VRQPAELSGSDNSYLLINILIAGVIIMIIIYSGIFSPVNDKYPVQCIHEKITGLSCPSCGLSRSFSYIVRGDLEAANEWNQYGLRVFLFFISQLILRTSVSMVLVRKRGSLKELIIFDVMVSIVSFAAGLGQFGVYYFKVLI